MKLTDAQEMMKESWQVYKKFYEVSTMDDEEYWSRVMAEFVKVMDRHPGLLSSSICEAFIGDMERRSKGEE